MKNRKRRKLRSKIKYIMKKDDLNRSEAIKLHFLRRDKRIKIKLL